MKYRLPDFAGKTVSFSTADSTLGVEEPRFETQGGRLFVVGIVPKGATTSDWAAGVRCAVAWEAVTDYLIFESVADYSARLAQSHRKKSLKAPKTETMRETPR
ncbi:MAG: hypothetical protein BWZ02_01108 [Lentisphaerae bacterium ADurb.BinA184]|nr:MAG: hypothetical protein BWZ02_01108 [Lentisphaerae bacterium ADurb.BinA184]